MQAKLHLISMPWANPDLPSIQTAVLKAFIDTALGKRMSTRTYSAFAGIVLEDDKTGLRNYFEELNVFEEYPYFMLYVRNFLSGKVADTNQSLKELVRSINSSDVFEGAQLSMKAVKQLENLTVNYIKQTIVPHLTSTGINVMGFTLNYFQLYASAFCAKYLQQEFPQYKYVFVFGGATVIYPKVAEVLPRLELEGLCVIGEGERKLELICKTILDTPATAFPSLQQKLSTLGNGIYDIHRRTINLYEPNVHELLSLQTKVEELPLPDFDEYYASLKAAFKTKAAHLDFKKETWLSLEGTRGCFAKCDFCDVHTSWLGFRKSPAKRVLDRALELVKRHKTNRIMYMDNVCDTWAEQYAELLIASNTRIEAFMECRVHHPETYWTKLSLSGVKHIQVGIEALAPALLRAMRKGTHARQNLLVQKWLKELGIASHSNLISHHPKSTLTDVAQTKAIVQLIPHLDRLDFSNLALLVGSPLDRALDPNGRRELIERQPFTLTTSLDKYFVLKGEYDAPESWFEDGVYDAWDELIAWEEKFHARCGEDVFLTAIRFDDENILVRDGRYGKTAEYYLEGAVAIIYDLCHRGPSRETICSETGLSSTSVEKILNSLIEKQILAHLDGGYIALGLRSRDELLGNYLREKEAKETVIETLMVDTA